MAEIVVLFDGCIIYIWSWFGSTRHWEEAVARSKICQQWLAMAIHGHCFRLTSNRTAGHRLLDRA